MGMFDDLPTTSELQVKIAEVRMQQEQVWSRYSEAMAQHTASIAVDPRFHQWAGEPPEGVAREDHLRAKLTELLAPYEPAAVRARMETEDSVSSPAPTSDRAVQAFRAKLGGGR
jgi:hypothetical protein